jgi:hypothetical protein
MLIEGDLSYAGISVVSVMSAGIGAFIGAYLKKKGENLATKEDFRELKAQTADLKQATKEIEAKIDDQVWNKQRQWEMKRDALFATVQALGVWENALSTFALFYGILGTPPDDISPQWQDKKMEATKALDEGMEPFFRARSIASLVAAQETIDELNKMAKLFGDCSSQIIKDGNAKMYSDFRSRFMPSGERVLKAIRRDLGIEK